MTSNAAAELVLEAEGLARDFGRMFSLDVSGSIETERWATLSRRPVERNRLTPERLQERSRASASGEVFGGGEGVELRSLSPQTVEEWERAEVFYDAMGAPVVNSAGDSLVIDPGWSTIHDYQLSGAHRTKAVELLRRASEWAMKRWRILSPMLWPGRGSVCNQLSWPDVVNRVSELANDATLPRPEWYVKVGPYAAWWPVPMWKRRAEFQLGKPQYTPEDEERIGDDPELVYYRREHWLRDSETALEWLGRQWAKPEKLTGAMGEQNNQLLVAKVPGGIALQKTELLDHAKNRWIDRYHDYESRSVEAAKMPEGAEREKAYEALDNEYQALRADPLAPQIETEHPLGGLYTDMGAKLIQDGPESALNWLKGGTVAPEPEPERLPDELSDDGLTLRWGGRLFNIKPKAAKVIQLLVNSYRRGFPYLSENYLKTEGGTESEMRHLVRDNGLEDVVIRQLKDDGSRVNGMWGLIDPKEFS